MNNAVLSGIISSPPQLRYSHDNKPMSEFLLAFQNASKSESVKQIKCVGFGKLAELIAQLDENQAIVLVGAINIISKESNGTKTKVTEFKISALDMVSSPVNVNSVSIAGRVGRDPEVRYFESGTNKTSCSLAVRRTSQTDWFDLEAWGKTGEVMGNYVRKGGLIGILGQIKFEEWTDKSTGELRSKPVILVGELELLGGKKEQEQEDF
jgi:single-strand DNA-binding protein